jgi:hypothetical protein
MSLTGPSRTIVVEPLRAPAVVPPERREPVAPVPVSPPEPQPEPVPARP